MTAPEAGGFIREPAQEAASGRDRLEGALNGGFRHKKARTNGGVGFSSPRAVLARSDL